MPGSSAIAYGIFQRLYPHYNPTEDRLMDLLQNIDPELPIFIVHLKEIDYFVSDTSIFSMVHTLSKYTNNLYFLALTDPTKMARHGSLNQVEAFQQAVNAFYKEHHLPYNEELALQGENLLKIAKNNTLAENIAEWDLIHCS